MRCHIYNLTSQKLSPHYMERTTPHLTALREPKTCGLLTSLFWVIDLSTLFSAVFMGFSSLCLSLPEAEEIFLWSASLSLLYSSPSAGVMSSVLYTYTVHTQYSYLVSTTTQISRYENSHKLTVCIKYIIQSTCQAIYHDITTQTLAITWGVFNLK